MTKNRREDNRPERIKLNNETTQWNDELIDKGVKDNDRGKLMNENYNAHIGKSAQEQRDEKGIVDNSTARHTWSEEQLERETRLESKQRESWSDTNDGNEAVEKAREVIKDEKSWWSW